MKKKVIIKIILFIVVLITASLLFKNLIVKKDNLMIDLTNKTKKEVQKYSEDNNLDLTIEEEYNESIEKGYVIDQSIKENTKLNKNDKLIVKLSLGKIDKDVYEKYSVYELGRVPIMMYHGIHNLNNNDTEYTGGNVDKNGYQRTSEAFRADLEFYYQNGYRMIRLDDYVNGIIDVELGKSPIILTFDDGLENNIKVTGLDEDGNIIIDPNSAVGILEEFKKKYPDFNVTATFFVNGGLFQQKEYNEKILNWLVDNGYDIGNHSYSHADFTKINKEKSSEEIGRIYNLLDSIIKDRYVNIVALPFGSPYSLKHDNMQAILNSSYNQVNYETKATLRVGWESDYSPFSKNFNPKFLKRIRAYDNNGIEFDIEMNFKNLEKNRYISDGNKNTIVVPANIEDDLINNNYNLEIIKY